MSRGRSIRIYLATGEVTGVRHAELVNWTGQAIACPRARLDHLEGWTEAQRPGVYFLVGAEQAGEREVYIGEAENVLVRLKSHLGSRDFWQEVVLFTSKDANLTKAHVKFLEHRLIAVAERIGRCKLLNGTGSRPSNLPRADQDAMEDFVDNLRVLLGALGHRFLVPLAGTNHPHATDGRLHYSVRGAGAQGEVSDEGFIVLAGSTALTDAKESMGTGNRALKLSLREAGKLQDHGELLRFTEDVLFTTPSQAASVIYGNAANGRVAWRDGAGRSLKEIEEAATASPPVVSLEGR